MLKAKRYTVFLDDMRIAVYASFIFIIILGAMITGLATNVLQEEPTLLYWWYGQSNVCLLFDFPPASYVLPFFWTITLTFWIIMSVLMYMRQGEAYLAGQLSKFWYYFLNYLRVQEVISVMFFSTIFAVTPDLNHMIAGDPTSFIVHSVPFLFMINALSTQAFSDSVYDISTGFASLRGARVDASASCRWYLTLIFPVILLPVSLFKMILLVNAIITPPTPVVPIRYLNSTINPYPCLDNNWPADRTCGGYAWCSNCPNFALTANVFDKLWLVLVLVPPLFKSVYVSIWQRDKIFNAQVTVVPRFVDKADDDYVSLGETTGKSLTETETESK